MRHRPDHPRAVLGRHAGQRHPAQVDGQQPLVRPGRAVTAARCIVDQTTATRTRASGVRVRHLLRHLARTASTPPTVGSFFGNEVDRRRDQPAATGPSSTSRGCMNRGNAEPDVPRHLPALPHRQRRGTTSAATCTGTPISGDLTSGCTGAAPNGARGCFISRDRCRRRRRRRLHRLRRRLGLRQPGRGDAPTPDAGPRVGQSVLPNRPVDPDRGRPLELADRLHRRTPGSARPPRATPATSSRPPTAAALDRHQRQPAGRRRSTRSCSTRPTRTRSTPAPTSARSSRPTAAASGAPLGTGFPKVATWQLDFDSEPPAARRRHPRPRRLHAQ